MSALPGAAVAGGDTASEPGRVLWQTTLAQLSGLPAQLDPFLFLETWDRRPTMRAITHIALLVRLAAGDPQADHPTLTSFTAFLSDFVREPRLQRLLDRKIGDLPYFLWLAHLFRDQDGGRDLGAALASRLRHPHALAVERTAHGRFLLAWHLRALDLRTVTGIPAICAGELAPFRRLARFRAGLDDALEILELSFLIAGAREQGSNWQRELAAAPPLAGLGELVEQALAVLLRGEDAVPLAAMLASAHLLDSAPYVLRRLALGRLTTLWLKWVETAERPVAAPAVSGVGSTGTVVAIAMRLAERAP